MYKLNIKHIIFFIFLMIFKFGNSQKENVYVLFDSKSKKTYMKEVGNGSLVQEKYFQKGIAMKNGIVGKISFSIKDELFELSKKESIDTCGIEYLGKVKLSTIGKLKPIVDKTNPLYPAKVFPKLYFIEQISDSLILKYRVDWIYYIE